MQKCKKCRKTKNIKEFYSSYKTCCKKCCIKESILWHKNHPPTEKDKQKQREYQKHYRIANPDYKIKQAEYYREWYAKYGRKRSRQDRELINLWQKLNPEKCRTYHLVLYAVKVGKIKKPKYCSKCRLERKLVAHHDDYKFPLKVRWLCYSCHKKKHNSS